MTLGRRGWLGFGHPPAFAPLRVPLRFAKGGATGLRLGCGFRRGAVGCVGMTVGVSGLYCEAQNM